MLKRNGNYLSGESVASTGGTPRLNHLDNVPLRIFSQFFQHNHQCDLDFSLWIVNINPSITFARGLVVSSRITYVDKNRTWKRYQSFCSDEVLLGIASEKADILGATNEKNLHRIPTVCNCRP